MTDEQILRQGRADFRAAIDPENPNSSVITGRRVNSSPTLDTNALVAQAKHVDSRMRQAARAAEQLQPSLDRFKS